MKLFELTDRWVPPRLATTPEAVWHARLVGLLSMAGCIWGPVFAYFYFFHAHSVFTGTAVLLAGAGTAAMPWLLHRTGNLSLVVHGLCSILYVIVLIVTVVRSSYPVSALMWSMAIPPLALFLAGRRHALIWTSLVALKYLALGLLTASGLGWTGDMTKAQMLGLDMLGLLGFLILLLSIVLIYEAERHRALSAAQEANRAKSEFLARMSHEIRTPMYGVIGMTRMLDETSLTVKQRDYVDTIRHSGGALLDIINDILDFSKIEAGKLELQKAVFDLREELDSVIALFAGEVKDKGLELDCRIGDEVPRGCHGDAGRLRQILINLIGNAVKFTAEGRVSVRVSASEPEEEPRVRFDVSDTGIGIPAEKLPTIFQAFSQVEESAVRRFDGTGLGLAISQQLTVLMGGEIRVKSHLGQGSTFSFTLPLERATDESTTTEEAAIALARPGARILVAEDNPVNQKVTQLTLQNLGYDTEIATSGIEVLEALARSRFDLVLMDCHMPEMDGYQTTVEIRKHPELAAIPIVAMTANAQASDREKCLEAGMDDYLPKPVGLEELAAVLGRWIGREES